ncbi:MAG: DUF2177 family protein [Candidatus Acetothermia bacterium]
MTLGQRVLLYLISLGAFLIIDFTWLGWVAKDFYARHLDELMSRQINWPAAFFFYLLFVGGLLVFVIEPALDRGSLFSAILRGAFFGIVAYATYDLTNLATLEDWPIVVTVVDLIWGGVLSGLVSAVGYLLGFYLFV